MNILFLHRNFPAQFRYILNELVKNKENNIVFITNNDSHTLAGVQKIHWNAVASWLLDPEPWSPSAGNHFFFRFLPTGKSILAVTVFSKASRKLSSFHGAEKFSFSTAAAQGMSSIFIFRISSFSIFSQAFCPFPFCLGYSEIFRLMFLWPLGSSFFVIDSPQSSYSTGSLPV